MRGWPATGLNRCSLANRRPMDPPDIGTILLHRLSPTEGTTVSAVSLAAPKDAKKAYQKGMDPEEEEGAGRRQRTSKRRSKSIPKYAIAWYEWAVSRPPRGRRNGTGIFEQALGPTEVRLAVHGIAVIEWKDEKWPQVAELTRDGGQARFVRLSAGLFPERAVQLLPEEHGSGREERPRSRPAGHP